MSNWVDPESAGRFVRIESKLDGVAEGEDAAKAWMHPLLDGHKVNEKFAHKVHYRYRAAAPLPTPPIAGHKGTLAPSELSFIYLDVGAWVGTKSRPWGGKPSGLKRDFGIVCGPLVLLCSFSYAHAGASCGAWTRANKDRQPYKSVAPLLEALAAEAGELGAPVVRDLLFAPSGAPGCRADPKSYRIDVILGDMHVPVLDKESQTYGGAATEKEIDRDHFEVSTPERVPRHGRLDIRTLETLITSLVGSDDTKMLDRLIALATPLMELSPGRKKLLARLAGADALVALPALIAEGMLLPALLGGAAGAGMAVGGMTEESWRRGDWKGVADDTMTAKDAQRWWQFYREGVHGNPADIFEDAGEHFLLFMKGLAAYQEKALLDDDLPRAKFFQLGDMMDFWVGFTCHYEPSKDKELPLNILRAENEKLLRGSRMVTYWATNMLEETGQGKHVAEATGLAEDRGLEPVYLYGNHDNYLGSGLTVDYLDPDGTSRTLPRRTSHYARRGIFMEHGHQWEGSNADNKATLPLVSTLALGTPTPLGMFVTQASFIRPAPVRLFEGKAAGLLARGTGGLGQRMDQIAGAVSRYIGHAGGFFVYVMGHTHEACLTRVVVSTEHPGTIATFQKENNGSPRTKLFLSGDGGAFKGERYVLAGYGPADQIKAEWNEMLGSKESEWVALEDKFAPPPGSLDRSVKGLAFANQAGVKDGIQTFSHVPPGLYQARFYLTRDAGEPFRRSPNAIGVQGISLEGDAGSTAGRDYVWDAHAQKLDRAIYLRWAFDPAQFNAHEAWVALCRPKHDPRVTLRGSNPHHRFVELAGGAPGNWGRWELSSGNGPSRAYLDALTREPHGEWELRAFMDLAQEKPIGVARLHVSFKEPHVKKRHHG